MPERNIKKNYRNITGVLGGCKNQGEAQFESTLEQDFLLLLEHDPNVIRYEVQPVTIAYLDSNGYKRKYTPDVLVEYKHKKNILFEVKYHEEVRSKREQLIEKIRAAVLFSIHKGWNYKIVTEHQIRTDYFSNVRFLFRYRQQPINDPLANKVERTLYELRESTPEALTHAVVHDKWNQAKALYLIWQMLAQGYIKTDLGLPLTMNSPIWLSEEVNVKY